MATDVMQFQTILKLDFIDSNPQCLQIIYLFCHQRYETEENRTQKIISRGSRSFKSVKKNKQ